MLDLGDEAARGRERQAGQMARRGTGGDSGGTRPGPAAAAAADLYGLPRDEFITARTELARRARADGDRAAAAAIGRLPKPSVVAWLANQLARQHEDEIQSLLKLGAALRAATADLDAAALRQLSGQQHQVLSALAGRAREVGAAAGQAVSDSTARGLEDTLHAALADEAAARQLTEGQLAAGLSRTGFPGIDADADAADADAAAAWAIPPRKRSGPAAPATTADPGPRASTAAATPAGTTVGRKAEPGRRGQEAAPATKAKARTAGAAQTTEAKAAQTTTAEAAETTKAKAAEARRAKAAEAAARAAEAAAEARRQQLGRARQAEAQARRDARDAARDREQAQAALTQAEAGGRRAAETVSRLQDELGAALTARNDAAGAQRRARAEADRAGRTARQADRRLAAAASRREDLERER
jgi:hypothetical protein